MTPEPNLQHPERHPPVVTQAVVLVGGKGTRLGELTRSTPKPLLEVAPGMRFLDALLFELARHGFTDITLLAGHLGEQFEAAYQNSRVLGATITVIREPSPQGTAGALRFVADRLDEWFLMTNGDSFFEFNLRALTAHPTPGMTGRLALRHVPDASRYGTVDLAGERITAFREKDATKSGPALINGGVYLLNRAILDLIHGPASIEQDVFPVLASSGRLEGRAFEGYFLDIGLPETYAQAQAEIPARRIRPTVFIDHALITEAAGPAIRRVNETGRYAVAFNTPPDKTAYLAAALALHAAHLDAAFPNLPTALAHWPYIEDSAILTATPVAERHHLITPDQLPAAIASLV